LFSNGYGMFPERVNGRLHQSVASRVAYELTHGVTLGPKDFVCHNCPGGDNKACCNPAHLFVSDNSGNLLDASRKGRLQGWLLRGTNHPLSKLNPTQVREIRCGLRDGVSKADLARRYGVSWVAIHNIAIGRTWKDVT